MAMIFGKVFEKCKKCGLHWDGLRLENGVCPHCLGRKWPEEYQTEDGKWGGKIDDKTVR